MDFLTPEVREIALSLMAGLNCARSLTVSSLIRHGEWEQLVKLECSPSDYCCAEDYHRAASATGLLRKLDSRIEGIDAEQATFNKWLEAEQQCYLTNRRLFEIMDFGTLDGLPVHDGILDFIKGYRKNLLSLIGSGPDPCFSGRFGPGATVSDMSCWTTVLHKMSSTPTFTPSALPYLIPWVGSKWGMACANRGDDPISVLGNEYFTVNKQATIKRPCAKEPSINGFYQLGLGREMRRRLKYSGIDLDDGQDTHRQVACLASKSEEFCTIDLSSASDTVCRALVKLVMPLGWYNHLEDLRSPYTYVKSTNHWYRLEKFSSMGNGYTFELETALFAALVMTCRPGLVPGHDLWVYGDDIICPTESARDVLCALRFFGFTPNLSKTFISGPFRESCGGDFYNGQAVRPFHIKELPNEPQQYIALANGLRRLAYSNCQGSSLFSDIRHSWFRCLDNLPGDIRRCRGPDALGDLVIHDDESRWSTRWRPNCIRYVRVYRPAHYKGWSMMRFDPDVQYAGALYGVRLTPLKPNPKWPEGFDFRNIVGRDGVEGYKVGWVPYS